LPSPATKISRHFKCYAFGDYHKALIQKLRDDDWETLLEEVTLLCKHQDIEVPDMDTCFSNMDDLTIKKISNS
jgi:hypothetical protein